MFLLYSGVKTLHQKPSQLLLTQTLRRSVEFICSILFIYLQNSLYLHRKDTNTKTCTTIEDPMLLPHLCIIHALFLCLSLCLSTSLLKNSPLWRELSGPSLFPWHLSLNNQRWRPESSCSPGKSSGWWLQQSEAGKRRTGRVSDACYQNTERIMLSKLTLRPVFPSKASAIQAVFTF